jgi:hypothetical protein
LHNAHIIETDGLVFSDFGDELFFPHVTHCNILLVDIKDRETSQDLRVSFHDGPEGEKSPYLIRALENAGKINKITVIVNEYGIQGKADKMKRKLVKHTKASIDKISINSEEHGHTCDVFIKNNRCYPCNLNRAKDMDQVAQQFKKSESYPV